MKNKKKNLSQKMLFMFILMLKPKIKIVRKAQRRAKNDEICLRTKNCP
jgi:hypothetical protein